MKDLISEKPSGTDRVSALEPSQKRVLQGTLSLLFQKACSSSRT